MSTDLELLELAAKAMGLSGEWKQTFGGWDCLVLKGSIVAWQPLHDDGDALRLAVKLGMGFVTGQGTTLACCRGYRAVEHHGDDQNAATRRAITRAAAQFQAQQPGKGEGE